MCPAQICVRLEKLYVRLVFLNFPAGTRNNVTLYRPVGSRELEVIKASGWPLWRAGLGNEVAGLSRKSHAHGGSWTEFAFSAKFV